MPPPAMPAFGTTMSTVERGEKAIAALKAAMMADQDVTSVLTNCTLEGARSAAVWKEMKREKNQTGARKIRRM
jgi:hypothetical protein